MLLDTSAVVAVIMAEAGYEVLLDKIRGAQSVAIASPSVVEAGMVISNRSGKSAEAVTRLMRDLEVIVIPFNASHAERALDAFDRFGKGRHPARLNIMDCMNYAVAMETGRPLLFVGNDFSKTDVRIA